MLTQLDYELFPDNPEVYRVLQGELVAKIYKNATSSLNRQGYKLVDTEEIKQASSITVFWREPIARFKSGVSTFVKQSGTSVDDAVKYLFLNRHYAPQFYTLLNLKRFMNESATFRFHDIADIGVLTDIHEVPYATDIHVPVNNKVHFYLTCDKMIWERYLDTNVHIDELMRVLRTDYKDYYREVIRHSLKINACLQRT